MRTAKKARRQVGLLRTLPIYLARSRTRTTGTALWSTPSHRARGGSAIWNHGHETSQRTFCPYLAVSCTQHHNHL